jgi:pantothenate kinase type III
MAVLVIDAGNSRLKWARAEGAQLGPSRAAAHAQWSRADYVRRLRRAAQSVDGILVSSVAGAVRAALRRWRAPRKSRQVLQVPSAAPDHGRLP